MDTIEKNPLEFIGANGPPEPTPYEASLKEIEDLYDECSLWLDGTQVDSQPLADGIGNLMDALRAAIKRAKAAHKAEKAPLDERVAEIQARYNLLIGETKTVKGKALQALEACAEAVEPWLVAEKKRIEDEARKKREAAEAATLAAQEALRAADRANLVERAQAEQLVVDARRATTSANKADRQTATAGGAMGRSISLRAIWTPTITDEREFARYVWANHQAEITEMLPEIARRLVAQGKRELPGVTITEERKAV